MTASAVIVANALFAIGSDCPMLSIVKRNVKSWKNCILKEGIKLGVFHKKKLPHNTPSSLGAYSVVLYRTHSKQMACKWLKVQFPK